MPSSPRRAGRRPGAPDTRGEILAAARGLLAERSPGAVTVRAVAAAAGVDGALVHHYFGTKRALFAAALQLPFDPEAVVEAVLDGPVDRRGERLARAFFGIWEDETARATMLGLLRTAVSTDPEAGLITGFVHQLMLPLAQHRAGLEPRDVELALSHLVGLAVVRYVVRAEPLASEPAEDLVATVAPSIQRYLGPAD